jgi:hypothetical protein
MHISGGFAYFGQSIDLGFPEKRAQGRLGPIDVAAQSEGSREPSGEHNLPADWRLVLSSRTRRYPGPEFDNDEETGD